MAYAAAKDVLARYPHRRVAELTAKPPEPGEEPKPPAPDKRRLDVALEDASAEVDSYIGRVASLPLADPPPVLRRLTVDIAIYRLMSLLPKEMVEDARQRYEDAVRWLESVASGEIALEGKPAQGAGDVAYFAPTRVFDANGLKGYLE